MEREYRISTGDVEHGDVGFCFSVIADSDENAIEKVRQAIEKLHGTNDGGIDIEDGVLADLSALFPDLVRDAGFKYHVACTDTVFHQYIEVPDGVTHQDIKGRAWDVLWMLRCAIKTAPRGRDTILYKLYVRNHNHDRELDRRDLVTLKSVCGPGDDAEPVITIMLPEED